MNVSISDADPFGRIERLKSHAGTGHKKRAADKATHHVSHLELHRADQLAKPRIQNE